MTFEDTVRPNIPPGRRVVNRRNHAGARTCKSSPAPPSTFKALSLIDPLLQALDHVGYKTPTDIQLEDLPHALEGRDIIGIASTGSGKQLHLLCRL